MEIIARIIVSGLIISPVQNEIVSKHDVREASTDSQYSQMSNQYVSRVIAHKSAMNTAFLRHTFNRIDLLAVVSYWIDLLITLVGVQHFFLFKAISTLRSLRLLAITSGCATILQSLKKSAPLLVNVTSFIGFFFILLSIIGVQAFKGSFSRRCVWKDINNSSNVYLHEDQYCGGWMDIDGSIKSVGVSGSLGGKGFICPIGQICEEVGNPSGGLASFDNVFFSMILVFVISTSMYYLIIYLFINIKQIFLTKNFNIFSSKLDGTYVSCDGFRFCFCKHILYLNRSYFKFLVN